MGADARSVRRRNDGAFQISLEGSTKMMKRAARSGLIALCSLVGFGAVSTLPATAENIRVFMDYARVLKLDRAVSKVIIGNPNIADVTVSDPQTIVVTGRSFGVTNLVIIDTEGTTLVDERIVVARDGTDQLRVYRNTEPSTLICSPTCERPSEAAAAVN
jgi:Flp pilus assembly secretin CpaC